MLCCVVLSQLLHVTEVDDVPYAITQFTAYGKALIGVGNVLRIYDLGKRKLLRKCETKALPTMVQSIHCNGDRVYCGDAADSVFFLKYKRSENVMIPFADDLCGRYLTATAYVDYSTIAAADKFGNVFVLRLPKEVRAVAVCTLLFVVAVMVVVRARLQHWL